MISVWIVDNLGTNKTIFMLNYNDIWIALEKTCVLGWKLSPSNEIWFGFDFIYFQVLSTTLTGIIKY